ncbi:MAG: DNA polymerase III subunit delta [Candidatus Berkelbacteria bacterium Licking1014_96]|uniref:DNA polymerase III subunit delta n=1 Tax=Candidatus Berkelbacteria bacterium Licking1014_96 TaxID=2017149 RepID=A0A554LH93_9BACT|nr:MAG: DNA polymerase III subunit delta [Candidatus Berkelbacteria bacterium Licking1014_96]
MIIFIFGDDTYQSQKRLKELKEKFKEKYGDINISNFSVDQKKNPDLPRMMSEIASIPFLGSRRLVTINNLILHSDSKVKEVITKKLPTIPESAIIIFFEAGAPKKNDKLFKLLLKIAKTEEFPQLRGTSLSNWIKKEAANRGAEIEPAAAEKLNYLVGSDTWRLSCEIEKLASYSYPQIIKKEDVELLVNETLQTKIFDLVDGLARRDGRLALTSLHRLMSLGEKKEYLFSMIVYGFRNLILVKYLLEKNTNEAEIKNILRLHPFVAQKTAAAARLFTFLELKSIYHRLVLASGEMRKSYKDPILVLDLLLAEICIR